MIDAGSAWQAYEASLNASPLVTKAVTASILLGAADASAQALESRTTGKEIDAIRIARFAVFGLVLQAPWNHFYYQLLDGVIPPTEQALSATNIGKLFIDQFVQAPVFTALIFVFLGALEGQGVAQIKRKLEVDYTSTLQANWKLWVPAAAINIAVVPPVFRVLYINVVFFVWSIYLSGVANAGGVVEQDE